jgi:hypothetical protein
MCPPFPYRLKNDREICILGEIEKVYVHKYKDGLWVLPATSQAVRYLILIY